MTLSRRAGILRQIAGRLNLSELKKVVAQPGVNEAFRLSIDRCDLRIPNTVATLRRGHGGDCSLTVIHDRGPVRYDFTVPLERYQKLLAALRLNHFDTMDDEPDLPITGVDVWLVERVMGSFHHDVVLSPDTAKAHHREIVLAIKTLLPEAVHKLTV